MISAGGTGGHLYPAQALAQDLSQHLPHSEILFMGGGLNTNRCFDQKQFSYKEIACSPLISKNPCKVLKGFFYQLKGIKQSLTELKKFQPDIVIGFGSYYTLSPLIAAKLLNIPTLLHEANSVPGIANRWLAKIADCIALQFPEAASYFNKECIHANLPLRAKYKKDSLTKEKACHYYNLSGNQQILLVCGGSQGATFINQLLSAYCSNRKIEHLQIIHLTGNEEAAQELKQFYKVKNIRSSVHAFEKNMEMAWTAADFFVGRAGAATIAEATEFEVPGILIPYPFATNNHQEKNAKFFTEKMGGGYMLLQANATEDTLHTLFDSFSCKEHVTSYSHSLHLYKTCSPYIPLWKIITHMLQTKKE